MTTNNKYYDVVAVDSRFIPADSADRTDCVQVTVRVVSGPETGREFTAYLSLGEKSAAYTAQGLRNLGWACNDITALNGVGTLKARMRVKPYSTPSGTKEGYSFFPIEDRSRDEESLRGFAKKYAGLATVPVIPATSANSVGTLPPPVTMPAANSHDPF